MASKKKRTEKARLDADGKAKPKTHLVKHVPVGHCVGPTTHLDSMELRDDETGERIPLFV